MWYQRGTMVCKFFDQRLSTTLCVCTVFWSEIIVKNYIICRFSGQTLSKPYVVVRFLIKTVLNKHLRLYVCWTKIVKPYVLYVFWSKIVKTICVVGSRIKFLWRTKCVCMCSDQNCQTPYVCVGFLINNCWTLYVCVCFLFVALMWY